MEKCNTPWRRRLKPGNIHRVTTGRDHTYPWSNREHLVRQLFQRGARHGGVQHCDRETAGLCFDRRKTFLGTYRGDHLIPKPPQIHAHHSQEGSFIIHDQYLARLYHQRLRFYTDYLTFNTAKHREYLNITPQVESALAKSGIREGMILVSAMHITAGVWVNDAEDGLIADIDEWLEKLAPFREDYRHHRTGETNGDSHLKSLLVHHEVIVPVTAGKLDFGPWQQVYYAEFDGQRPKRLIIKVMGE